MTISFYKNYLKFTAFVVGSFGPVFSLGTMIRTSGLPSWTLDVLSMSMEFHNFEAPTTRFLSALTGGFLLGWGVTIWFLQAWVFDKAPEETRKTVLVGLLAWFVLDSAGSIASGNPSNAWINILVLLIAVGPLWKPIKHSK